MGLDAGGGDRARGRASPAPGAALSPDLRPWRRLEPAACFQAAKKTAPVLGKERGLEPGVASIPGPPKSLARQLVAGWGRDPDAPWSLPSGPHLAHMSQPRHLGRWGGPRLRGPGWTVLSHPGLSAPTPRNLEPALRVGPERVFHMLLAAGPSQERTA